MRKFLLGAVATLFLGAPGLLDGAQAASIGLDLSLGGPALEPVQYYTWQDRRYCWYDAGWHGPGYYWCGDYWRRSGLGWGGPMGWHGWRHHYRHPARPHYRGHYRGGHSNRHHSNRHHSNSHHGSGGHHRRH